MLKPEEMMELYQKLMIDKRDWKWNPVNTRKDGTVYVPECSQFGDTLIMLEDTYEGSDEDCLYIEAACEFVPYVAERLIEVDKLLDEVTLELQSCADILEDEKYLCDLDDVNKIIYKIKQFLEAAK
jgi:hypothetical protein